MANIVGTIKKKAEKVFSPRKPRASAAEDTGGDMTIGAPVFQGHHTHVTVDKDGNIEGLPEEMKNMLKVSGAMKKDEFKIIQY